MVKTWHTTLMHLILNFLSACLQVHPGGLACGGDHNEGLHQPDAACDCRLRGPLFDFAVCPQSSSSVIRNRLHGHLHKVRMHTYHGFCSFLNYLSKRQMFCNFFFSFSDTSAKKSWPYVKQFGWQTTPTNMRTWFEWWERSSLCWRETSGWIQQASFV